MSTAFVRRLIVGAAVVHQVTFEDLDLSLTDATLDELTVGIGGRQVREEVAQEVLRRSRSGGPSLAG